MSNDIEELLDDIRKVRNVIVLLVTG